MSLFRVDASIRTEGSTSRAVADTVEATWRSEHPRGEVVRRDLGTEPLPADAWSLAVTAGWTPEEQRTDEQRAAVALAARLADELLDAEAYVVAVPLYNWGVSQHVKAWIDLVITDSRFAGGQSPLAGRPGVLVVARGGGYGEGTPKHGWDHATGYLVRVLAEVWGMDLRVVEAELTLAEVVPAMAELKPLAAQNLAAAHAAAEQHGRVLAAQASEQTAA